MKTQLAKQRLEVALRYDVKFYLFKNGRLNVAKLCRCAGVSASFARRILKQKEYI